MKLNDSSYLAGISNSFVRCTNLDMFKCFFFSFDSAFDSHCIPFRAQFMCRLGFVCCCVWLLLQWDCHLAFFSFDSAVGSHHFLIWFHFGFLSLSHIVSFLVFQFIFFFFRISRVYSCSHSIYATRRHLFFSFQQLQFRFTSFDACLICNMDL